MDFGLDDTSREITDLAAAVTRREVTGEPLWKAMAQAGLLTLAIPERLGGAGLGALETALVLAEVGRAGAIVPALATLALGVLPTVHLGTPAQQDALLAPVVSSAAVLTAAIDEPSGARQASVRGGVITGTKTGVPYAREAHRMLVCAGAGVYIVDPADPGVALIPTPTSSGAPECTVRLTDVPAERLGDGLPAELTAFAVAGACAMGDGLLAGALDLTTEHVRTRQQFGRPLAAFQAVAQQIADIYVAARTTHLAVRSAVWQLSTGRDATTALDVAAYWLAEELPLALHTCHHLHGGLGVDITYPLHRYYSLGKDLVRSLGGVTSRLDRLCTSI